MTSSDNISSLGISDYWTNEVISDVFLYLAPANKQTPALKIIFNDRATGDDGARFI